MNQQNQQPTICQEVIQSLILYIDQEQCSVPQQQIADHLFECPDCSAERDALALMKTLIARSCCAEPAPPTVRVKITQIITQIRIEGTDG